MEGESVNFDNEVLAFLTMRKDDLIQQHSEYIARKPEIREVLNDFLSAVLLSKPVSKAQALINLSDLTIAGRCIRVRKRVLPPIQP